MSEIIRSPSLELSAGKHWPTAVGCALGYLDLRFPDLDWRGAHQNLGKLYEKLMQRASFAETAPPKG